MGWINKRVMLSDATPGLPYVPGPPPPDSILTGPEQTVQKNSLGGESGTVIDGKEEFLQVSFDNGKGTFWLPKAMFSISIIEKETKLCKKYITTGTVVNSVKKGD
jgi:hypothetical protein